MAPVLISGLWGRPERGKESCCSNGNFEHPWTSFISLSCRSSRFDYFNFCLIIHVEQQGIFNQLLHVQRYLRSLIQLRLWLGGSAPLLNVWIAASAKAERLTVKLHDLISVSTSC